MPLSAISFFFLKLYVHYFGYRRIKYLDDGRDFVSVKEFLSVHCTFSVLNSWTTYFFCYNVFVYLQKIIGSGTKNNEFIDDYMAIIAILLMAFESTIYLAYYKDVIFSFITLFNIIGMYLFNYDTRNSKDLPDLFVLKYQISLIVILSVFIVVTILHDFDKVFYLQYAKFYNKYKERRLGIAKGKKVQAEGFDEMRGGGGRGRNYSFVAWKQYFSLQHGDRESSRIEESVSEDISVEVDAPKEIEMHLEENGSELDFGGNRSPLEEIESESMISKKLKGSVLSSRIGRQSEELNNRSP